MEYRSGSINRVFVIRFDHGDDFLEGMKELAHKEKVRNGWFHVIGGLAEADVVIGPKQPVMPPDPIWEEVRSPREVLGTGSLFWNEEDEPLIHLHTSLGEHGQGGTVCTRKGTKTYLILEVYLMEVSGFAASRPWYETGGFNRLTFAPDR
ncbi:MAG: PPC domain-containing DNA-binding protein [Thermodesulfobacteriota bacterium]